MSLISRHQRIISLFKFLFIIGISAILLLLYFGLGVPKSSLEHSKSQAVRAKSLPVQNYEITMVNSIFEGFADNMQPYKIIADTAVKINDNVYELNKVIAKYKLSDDELLLNARHGIIDNNVQLITLNDGVQILLDGIQCNTAEMLINLFSNQATSDAKVVINYKESLVTADKLSASGVDHTMKLNGHVKVKMNISDF